MKFLLSLVGYGAAATVVLVILDKMGKLPTNLVPYARFAEGTIQGRFGSTAIDPATTAPLNNNDPASSGLSLSGVGKSFTNIFTIAEDTLSKVAGSMGFIADPVRVARIADAIAYAEGAQIPGSRPYRNNNPGDLTVDLNGKGVGTDGPFIVYRSMSDGMDALKKQVTLMLTNQSKIYNRDMTIQEVANNYTSTQQLDWARNVATRLGASVNDTIATV